MESQSAEGRQLHGALFSCFRLSPWGSVAVAVGLALLVLILDQVSKSYIVRHFLPNQRFFASPIVSLIFVTNSGGVCGYAQSAGVLLAAIGVVTIAFIVAAIFFFMPNTLFYAGAFGLLLAGAAGNLIDRLRFGYVVDFITLEGLHWPSFNLADASIMGGIAVVGLLTVLEMLFDRGAAEPAAFSSFKWTPATVIFLVVAAVLVVAAYVLCVFHPFG